MARRPKDFVDPQAVSAAEAAALMGVHFVMPRRMHEKGLLSAHIATESANVDEPERLYALYDSEECDGNYRDYEEKVAARGGKNDRRPRSWLHLRPLVVAHLKTVKAPIAFDDAVTLGEAAAILGVHHTLVPRMLRDGKIVGRIAWSPRGKSGPRFWIVSRRSCLANVKEIKAAEAAGTKRGRHRQKLKAK
jgi:hypothetical protein